jgi:hypothetical protein
MDLINLERASNQSSSLHSFQANKADKEKSNDFAPESNLSTLEKIAKQENKSDKNSIWEDTENSDKKRIIDNLRSIDAEVRAHEMSHLAAAGQFATSGPTYVYITGPDGKQYAVGGEISISLSSVSGNPEATIQKARAIRNAALSVGDPSSADLSVAAAATQIEMAALASLAMQRFEKTESSLVSTEKELETGKVFNHPALQGYSSSMQLHDAEPIVDMYA